MFDAFQTLDVDLREGSGSSDLLTLATENTPGSEKIQMPIIMAQGMKDTTIIPQLTPRVRQTALPDGGTPSTSISIRTTLTQAWWSHRETLCSPGSRIDSTATLPRPTARISKGGRESNGYRDRNLHRACNYLCWRCSQSPQESAIATSAKRANGGPASIFVAALAYVVVLAPVVMPYGLVLATALLLIVVIALPAIASGLAVKTRARLGDKAGWCTTGQASLYPSHCSLGSWQRRFSALDGRRQPNAGDGCH